MFNFSHYYEPDTLTGSVLGDVFFGFTTVLFIAGIVFIGVRYYFSHKQCNHKPS